jgi:hypothetical protein
MYLISLVVFLIVLVQEYWKEYMDRVKTYIHKMMIYSIINILAPNLFPQFCMNTKYITIRQQEEED